MSPPEPSETSAAAEPHWTAKLKAPLQLVIICDDKDYAAVQVLMGHLTSLQHQRLVETWHPGLMNTGGNRPKLLQQRLDSAQVFVLFVSPDFLLSDWCYSKALATALECARKTEVILIPVRARGCDVSGLVLDDYQFLPKDGHAVLGGANIDAVWAEVVADIRKTIITHPPLSPRTPAASRVNGQAPSPDQNQSAPLFTPSSKTPSNPPSPSPEPHKPLEWTPSPERATPTPTPLQPPVAPNPVPPVPIPPKPTPASALDPHVAARHLRLARGAITSLCIIACLAGTDLLYARTTTDIGRNSARFLACLPLALVLIVAFLLFRRPVTPRGSPPLPVTPTRPPLRPVWSWTILAASVALFGLVLIHPWAPLPIAKIRAVALSDEKGHAWEENVIDGKVAGGTVAPDAAITVRPKRTAPDAGQVAYRWDRLKGVELLLPRDAPTQRIKLAAYRGDLNLFVYVAAEGRSLLLPKVDHDLIQIVFRREFP